MTFSANVNIIIDDLLCLIHISQNIFCPQEINICIVVLVVDLGYFMVML